MGAIDREYIESLVTDYKVHKIENIMGYLAFSCMLSLKNGFVVTGNCNVLDNTQCDETEAQQTAIDRAFMEVVRLEAYRHRENERLDQVKTEPPQNQEESQTK